VVQPVIATQDDFIGRGQSIACYDSKEVEILTTIEGGGAPASKNFNQLLERVVSFTCIQDIHLDQTDVTFRFGYRVDGLLR